MTRRILKWALGVLAILIALPVVTVVIVLIAANTGPGRRLIEAETASLTGGMVRIHDLAGRFPDALRAGEIEVSDAKGRYVSIQGLTLNWSPFALIRRTAQVDLLSATRVEVSRLPESSSEPSETSSGGGGFNLPVRVDLRRLQVAQVAIDAPVAGAAAKLTLDGSGQLETLTQGSVHLIAERLDTPGRYAVDGAIGADRVEARISAHEPKNGLISAVAGLPDLGAVDVHATVNGPWHDLGTEVAVSAGRSTASASGTVDLVHNSAAMAVKADAPAMAPAADVSWDKIQVNATVRGPFSSPDADGMVIVRSLSAGDIRVDALDAKVSGHAGAVRMHASAEGLRLPGPKPDLLAGAPVILDASAQLDSPARPLRFALHHPLMSVDGSADTAGERQAKAHLVVQELAPLAEAGGLDLHGQTELDLQATMGGEVTTATLAGKLAITGGMAPIPALIGPDGHIDLAASIAGSNVTLSRLAVNGRAIDVTASGGLADKVVKLDWTLGLSNLAAVQDSLSGTLTATGHASGQTDKLAAEADIVANMAAKGYSSGQITAHVAASGLPDSPRASVSANGTLLDAPLLVDVAADRTDGVIHGKIDQLSWKSLMAEGTVSLAAGASLPEGKIRLDFGRLADLEPLLGQPIAGQAAATLDADKQTAHLSVNARDVAIAGVGSVGKAALNAAIAGLDSKPSLDGSFSADGVSAGPAKSVSARMTATGPQDALAVNLTANTPALFGAAAKASASGTLNSLDRTLALASLEATWKQQVIKLLAPARLAFGDDLSVDRMRLGFQQAELSVSGSAGNKLDLTATLRNLSANVAALADPSLAADGVIAAEARLTGTTSRPEGTIKVSADRVHLRQGAGRGLPPASLTMNMQLQGTRAQLDTQLTAGQSHLALTGLTPLSATGALDLKAAGRVDLAMLDPLLSAQGRRARGDVNVNATITGTTSAPLANGTMVLTGGDVADYSLGVHITDLAANLEASGDTIRLARFSGRAGPGTLGGSGTLGLAGPMPVDLRFTADNARPLSSDLLTALIDANLTLQGALKGDLEAAGTIKVRRADIRIPEKLPASIVTLPVRDPNAPPPPPPSPSTTVVALNLTLNAPQQVFIRGRGVDAELGGTVHIHGTTSAPIPDGGFQLRRGTLSVIGTTLTFSEGSVDFSGAGIADPALHFVASSSSGTMTATLTISGSARDPKITLSSVPTLPQDEILAQLLFNTSTSKLSPLQLAQIAAALASLSGVTGGAGDPLEKLRATFGLDRLSVGSSSSGSPTLEAGRYLARGVYLGAKQSASGNGTQATVQVDIAKGLKLETTAGSGTSSATGATSSADAASIGLTYQFEY